ncbi:2'-5' RNA ligase family protein [Bdellovibrio sp. NC01]|uniref:2'-5' RNA ligase family protein n=1 Tax=Bdellovibrio sp. NC01 TaxID=2220073 RepID=UPI001157D334|nr:2'-5' RNA ligase family protein [Bdellovibrio sp. NC01]QDK37840.1 hypothetical protein DOE51_09700 [Bdellovibrio sp. NC01]
MRAIHCVFICALLTSCATQKSTGLSSLEIPKAQKRGVASAETAPFIRHEDKAEFKSYLAMNLPYSHYEQIRTSLEKKNGLHLINRGEAHITVVNPIEYTKLKKKISIKEIHDLAEKMNIQDAHYQKVCVGKGTAKVNHKDEETYFVVVHSDQLFEIRKAIQDLYVKRGGNASDFNAESFYPHVTLGYTKRDLHFEDGVVKDASSCMYTLQETDTAKK